MPAQLAVSLHGMEWKYISYIKDNNEQLTVHVANSHPQPE